MKTLLLLALMAVTLIGCDQTQGIKPDVEDIKLEEVKQIATCYSRSSSLFPYFPVKDGDIWKFEYSNTEDSDGRTVTKIAGTATWNFKETSNASFAIYESIDGIRTIESPRSVVQSSEPYNNKNTYSITCSEVNLNLGELNNFYGHQLIKLQDTGDTFVHSNHSGAFHSSWDMDIEFKKNIGITSYSFMTYSSGGTLPYRHYLYYTRVE